MVLQLSVRDSRVMIHLAELKTLPHQNYKCKSKITMEY